MEDGNQEQTQQKGNVVTDTAKDVAKEKVKKEVQKEVAKRAAETSAKLAAKSSIFAALGPILVWVLIIIVAIIVIVGIVMFFMTVPGMVMEQLKNFATNMAKTICSYFGADSTKQIEEQEIYDVLNYLEQMGYDLKGYGFISKNADKNDSNYDEKTGVIRDPETGLIKDLGGGSKAEAYSDIIGTYIMSDNYVYTVKNFNPTGWKATLENVFKLISPIGTIIDLMTDSSGWGKGLLTIKFENGDDYEKNYIDQIFGTNTSWLNIKVDPKSKKMGIRRGWGANYYEYNLDGWTGRYGMPLEFLLSLHIATMKPDLTYEMVTNFETDVLIKLKDVTGSVTAAYKTESGKYVTYQQIEDATQAFRSKGAASVITWLDQTVLGKDEAQAIFDLGFDHAKEGCNCFDEDGNLKTDANGNLIALDGNCKSYIKEAISELRAVNTYNMKTYVPYLSRVTDHWYRNVYWELSSSEATSLDLVKTDVEYEKQTNERWTLYQTYTKEENPEKEGEFKLYKLNKDGSYGDLYDGTQKEANEEGIPVVKKPVETHIKDLIKEGILDEERLKSDGSWSAYDVENTSSETYERVYPDEEESSIKGKLYYKEQMNNTVVQKEDGVRGTTNEKIKKMFLVNKYLSYDGSTETAETIMKIKDKLGIKFGALTDDQLKKELKKDLKITIDSDTDEDNPKTVADLASTVSITQDSLGAFSMLENTHTLDADYIYKDFKELIVELGYFTKEELSEGTPKLLQWLIPSIGSGGYPKRVLDKVENELGTFAHSKQDYEANEKDTLKNLITQAILTASPDNNDNTNDIDKSNSGNIEPEVKGTTNSLSQTVEGLRAKMGNQDQFVTISGVSSGSTSLLSLDEWWEETQKMFDIYKSESWVYSDHGQGQSQGCNAGTTFETHRHDDTDCSIGASWMLQKLGALKENHTFTSHMGSSGSLDESNACAQDLIDAGAEVILPPDGTKFSAAAGNGTLEPGDLLFYEGHVSIYCGESYNDAGQTHCWDTGSTTGIQCGGPRDTSYEGRDIELIVRLPLGQSRAANPYEGYLGDEAVVSPVTGILLDYGTYDKEDNAAGYRTNINKSDIEPESVGYAKILVLNEEIADQLVTCDTHGKDTGTKNGIAGKIDVSTPANTKELKTWSDDKLALYGYKLFKDDYEDGGIAGYIVYIDGFKCELPKDESETAGTGDKDREEIVWDENYQAGSGEELSMEYFKKRAAKGSGDNFKICEYEETLYEADEVYKLLSSKLEDQQKARAEAKNLAAPLYSFTGTLEGETKELLLIKEGTVIGRTYTDKEVVESRGETYVKPEEPEEGEEDTREVQGNYLRIIMRDLDDTVVENVEDYMKLDEEEAQTGDQEYQFQEGDLDLLADAIHHEGCGAYCAKLLGTSSEDDKLYLAISTGFTMINKLNSDSGYSHAAGWDWAPSKSPLYNLLCVVPCAACGGNGWYAISDKGTMGGLKNRADAGQYEYCDICYQAAEYIKENDSMNFKNNGRFGSQFSSGEGMPHTCWQQGSGYNGTSKIWVYIESAKFYLFDTAS